MYALAPSLRAPFFVRARSGESEFNALRLRACSTYQIARAAVRERGSRRTIVPAPGPSCGRGLHGGGGDGGAGGGSKTRPKFGGEVGRRPDRGRSARRGAARRIRFGRFRQCRGNERKNEREARAKGREGGTVLVLIKYTAAHVNFLVPR